MKKATSYKNLKALFGGLIGALQSARTEAQEGFDGWVRFVRRNGNIFPVAMVDELALAFNYEKANDVFAVGIIDGSVRIVDVFCFPSCEDISDSTAKAVRAAWDSAVKERVARE